MDSKLVKLPLEWVRRCSDFAERSVADYRAGRKNESLHFATHGMENDVDGQATSKMAECAFCLWADIDPGKGLDWSPRPDTGYDVIYRGSRVDVKQTKMTSRRLLWPFNKVDTLSRKHFDTFVLVKSDIPWFEVARWTSKMHFLSARHIAGAGDRIAAGNWYLDEDEMWPMRVFAPPDLMQLFRKYGEGTPAVWAAWERANDHWCAA